VLHWQHQIYARNAAYGNTLWLNANVKFQGRGIGRPVALPGTCVGSRRRCRIATAGLFADSWHWRRVSRPQQMRKDERKDKQSQPADNEQDAY